VAPVDVSIHSPHLVGGGVVKFTTDGGEPGELGHVFTRPFAVDASDEAVVTIKAVVLPHWRDGLAESDVATVSFRVLHQPKTPPEPEPEPETPPEPAPAPVLREENFAELFLQHIIEVHRQRLAAVEDFSLGLGVSQDGDGTWRVFEVRQGSCCLGLLREGDIINTVDDVEIKAVEDLRETCRGQPGSFLKLVFTRRGAGAQSEVYFVRSEDEETGGFALKSVARDAEPSETTTRVLPGSPEGGVSDHDPLFHVLAQDHAAVRAQGHMSPDSPAAAGRSTPVEGGDSRDTRRHLKDLRGIFSLESRCAQLERELCHAKLELTSARRAVLELERRLAEAESELQAPGSRLAALEGVNKTAANAALKDELSGLYRRYQAAAQ